jgi:hypothetical protein
MTAKKTAVAVLSALALFAAIPQVSGALADDHHDYRNTPVQTGYVIVTPTSADKTGLVVFETFGMRRGFDTLQAGVLPSSMTTRAMLFVNASGRLSRNLGAAIVNPATTPLAVQLDLRNPEGSLLATRSITVPAGNQTASFVTELFSGVPSVPRDLTGTLTFTGNQPFAVVALRFRGDNFSTIPATVLNGPADVPANPGGFGGPGSIILAHFATGGGWGSEIVLSNTSPTPLTVRVDLFKKDGTPLAATLNGQTMSTFSSIVIQPGGVVVMAPRDSSGDSDF